ncbi:muscular LMNA-interacting protein isoform X1 [Tachyglossus aculeatus]|uniref:muscular LMNA-interacting protein isoform X1 n=1 Tax=Tachyglossus aculeatus TaxID=9261 RepID=UPI0018F4A70D|nr:muscular LMNA-interacting protein isoform X1 [Tachyglossus aculeatus]
MELGKHEKQSSLNKNLKEKLTLHPLQHGQQIGSKDLGVTSSLSFLNSGQVPSGDSGTKPLIFTFVPTVRRLPAHSQIVDASKFLAKIEEEPRDENIRETINRSKAFSDSTSTSGIGQGSSIQTTAHYTDTSQKIFQGRRFKSKPEAMEQGDLFKAEYVFIVDSEGEEEATSRNDNKISSHGDNHRSLRPQSLDLPKSPVWGAEVPKKPAIDIHSPSRPELPPGIANQQKTAQLNTSVSPSDHLSCKPPAPSVSSTNSKVRSDLDNLNQSSILEEFLAKRLSVAGSSVHETATYYQTTAHSSPCFPSKEATSELASPLSAQQCGSKPFEPSVSKKPGSETEIINKTPTPSSHFTCSSETLITTSNPLSSSASLKFNTSSYIPVRILMHSLSPSPKPLNSPFYGSSSTLCSINNPSSQMSSSGNLSKAGIRSPLPTRLSLLTAILKSNPSHRRPFSPASCPPFSPSSLVSSTLALDQKANITPPTPKKSFSSFSLSAESPYQEEPQPPEFPHLSSHLPQFLKASPDSYEPLFSLKKHLSPGPHTPSLASSTPASPKRKTVSPPQLRTRLSSSSTLPPVSPSTTSLNPTLSLAKGKQEEDHRGSAPEKPKRLHKYSPTTSSPVLHSNPSLSRGPTLSSPEKCSLASSTPFDLVSRSKAGPSQLLTQELNLLSSASSDLSTSKSSSHSNASSPARVHFSSPELNSLSWHQNYTEDYLVSGKSHTSSLFPGSTPVSSTAPHKPLTRPQELTSLKFLSLHSDHENKKPKQYKIKSSYKAFAAIPTNTLLMEQKALDEPVKKESVPKDDILDPHQELCSPAQLRQQTEELCATIDKVLQDSLHHLESPSSSLQTLMDSDVNKIPSTLQRSAGRETKYANLSLPMSTVGESQLTKPGVIRPAPVKSKIILRKEEEEEPYEPNPFSKYLEDSSGPYAGQEAVSLHPLYQTKLFPPTKLLLPSQTIIGPHCVSPGPFSHLTAVSLSDKHENSHSSFSLKALYNKLSHPIVTIPENEALSSKEQ